jgi:uncharacterized membrane protein
MEILLGIAAIIAIVVLITSLNSVTARLASLERIINEMRDELQRLSTREPSRATSPEPPRRAELPTPPEPSLAPEPTEVIQEDTPVAAMAEVESLETETVYPRQESVAPDPPQPGFFERNPDLEKFIGENLANKIGIAILVLGIGFFVKYAIDQNWINEIGRVGIGILCGGLLLGLAHTLRRTLAAFSSVLVGGGIAVLYLTIAIAFHEYHLLSQTAAFLIMTGITGFAVLFSLAYNRKELAVLSILGGFASPFMVSTGEGNYIVLFTYVLILDLGMLVLAFYKKWNIINILSYVGTVLLFGSWMGARFQPENSSMIGGALIFATAFYLVFFVMNMINNLRKRTPFRGLEVSLLLSNTFLFYAAGMYALNGSTGHAFRGLFTAGLATFNFVFAFALYRSERVDRKVVYLLIGLVLTFASLAAPIQLSGHYITLFWAAEAVLLMWLSQKSGIRLMKLSSIIVSFLMIISLVMDWSALYGSQGPPSMTIIFNNAYIAGIFALSSLAACLYRARFEHLEEPADVRLYVAMVTVVGALVLYVSQFLELHYQLRATIDDNDTILLILGSYNMVFIIGILWYSKRNNLSIGLRQFLTFFGILGILGYVLFYHGVSIRTRNAYLEGSIPGTGLLFHYLLLALTLIVVAISLSNFRGFSAFNRDTRQAYSWFFVAVVVFLASAELDHLVVWMGYRNPASTVHLLSQNHKIGYPILWGITSFVLIFIGLKGKKRHLRVISLTLFLVTLVKLFTVDIRGISEGGKIAAFISLGVLLLVVSFMYQRLKKLLLQEEPQASTETR